MPGGNVIRATYSYIVSQLKSPDEIIRQTENKATRPFVTISRETGAGGTSVGEKLVNFLNDRDTETEGKWDLFDKNLIEKVIEEHHLPELFRNFLTEKKVSEIQDTFEQLIGVHPGMSRLSRKTCNTIVNLASMGKVVIIGRGANILTRGFPGGLHVRLIADMEWKIRHISSLYELKKKDAIKFIEEEDMRRKNYVKKLFNKNVANPLMYDLVINTSSMTFDEAAEIIGTRILHRTQTQNVHVAV